MFGPNKFWNLLKIYLASKQVQFSKPRENILDSTTLKPHFFSHNKKHYLKFLIQTLRIYEFRPGKPSSKSPTDKDFASF